MNKTTNISVTVSAANIGILASELLIMGHELSRGIPTTNGPTTTTSPSTKGRGKKAAPPMVEAEETIEEEFLDDTGDTDGLEDETSDDMPEEEMPEEEAEEVEEAPTPRPGKNLGLKDVTAALKKYAARGEAYRETAKKLLKKYKVNHVDDLPASKYAEVIKALK